METVKAKMTKELYFKIDQTIRDDIDIQEVVVDDFDYSDDEIWHALRKESVKAYKKLKEREYNLRHNLI